MQDQIFLAVDIFLHIPVYIQMIGRYVGDDRHIRALAHGDQLKAGKLHHSGIVRGDLFDHRQQSAADVAALVDLFSRCFEHFRNERCGRGFAVGPGNCIRLTGTQAEKKLHFGGDDRSLLPGFFQRGMMKIHPRRAKHRVIADQTVQIAVSQHQPDAALFKFIG